MSAPAATLREWAPLARRLGIGATTTARTELAAAARALRWTDVPPLPAWLASAPLSQLAQVLVGTDLTALERAARAPLSGGRTLIGLASTGGIRWYLLAQSTPGSGRLLTEAVLLFIDRPSRHPTTHPRSAA